MTDKVHLACGPKGTGQLPVDPYTRCVYYISPEQKMTFYLEALYCPDLPLVTLGGT